MHTSSVSTKCSIHHIFTVCLFTTTLIACSSSGDQIRVNAVAPDFTLLDQTNEKRSLSDFRGQWLVLYFYPMDFTPGCTTEACSFRDNWRQIESMDASVVGISVDDTMTHKAFAQKNKLPFTLLADPEGVVAEKYGALYLFMGVKMARRHSFIIGPEGRVRKVYTHVDLDDHAEQVIEDLEALQKAH